jgi:hypothetical protein
MYLSKEECKQILQSFVKESVGLLTVYNSLTNVYNLNDFNPNEKRMSKIKQDLENLNKVIESIQIYMLHAHKNQTKS